MNGVYFFQIVQRPKSIKNSLYALGVFQPAHKTKRKWRFKRFVLDYLQTFFPLLFRKARVFKFEAMFWLLWPAPVDGNFSFLVPQHPTLQGIAHWWVFLVPVPGIFIPALFSAEQG